MTDSTLSLSQPKIAVFRTVYDAYCLGIGAIASNAAMLRFFLYCSAFSFLQFALQHGAALWIYLNLEEGRADGIQIAISILSFAAFAFVQTPLGIAIQRSTLLGEQPDVTYLASVMNRRGRRYLLASILISVPFCLANFAEPVVNLALFGEPFINSDMIVDQIPPDYYLVILLTAIFGAYAGASLIATRGAFIFPSIATDRLASFHQGFGETRHATLRLLLILTIASVPLAVIGIAALAYAIVTSISPLFESLSISNAAATIPFDQVLLGLVQSPTVIIAGAVGLAAYMLWFLILAAGTARAYQISVDRGLSGIAEIFS